jgi:hypothetical protein
MVSTVLDGSSFHDCVGICMFAEFASHVTVTNNVFYRG